MPEEIIHYDLFAGIGGFSLALREVSNDKKIKTIFCEWDEFCTAVLKKHWPDETYYGDIADLVADTAGQRLERGVHGSSENDERGNAETLTGGGPASNDVAILTGGFPCQPFSAAGRRKGTADDRYQWPNMFEVIRNVKPDWVIAENVRGLTSWNEGMVLEQVCTDLEGEGYEVQPLIIPAVGVNAPHRRDRVWIIGHAESVRRRDGLSKNNRPTATQEHAPGDTDSLHTAAHTESDRRRPGVGLERQSIEETAEQRSASYPDWSRDWQEVAFATCNDSVDDGLPRRLGGSAISRAKWRKEALKAYGNAIVPQVAMNIFRSMNI